MEILIGILVSIVVEAKKHYGPKLNSFQTLTFVFILSLLAAVIVTTLQKTGHWDVFIKILLIAGGTHNIIFRQLKSDKQIEN